MELKGKVALVTGGATGIGRATVLALAKAGVAGVAINYRTAKKEVDQLAAMLSRVPRQVRGEVLVVTPMPCGGRAQCGVCTVATAKGAKLACEEGPVFPLAEIL